VTRVKYVPINVCNEIIEDYLELQKENEKLKQFEVVYVNRNGNPQTFKFKDVQSAFYKMDRIIGYGPEKRRDIALVCKQAGRIIKVYYKGKYMTPPVKDRVQVRKAS
jgi:hypothetical protein